MPNQVGQESWETDRHMVWDVWESLDSDRREKNQTSRFEKNCGYRGQQRNGKKYRKCLGTLASIGQSGRQKSVAFPLPLFCRAWFFSGLVSNNNFKNKSS